MSERNKLPAIHPGEILKEDVLEAGGLSANALATALCVPQSRIAEILAGRRAITAETALRLARYLGTTPEFWLHLQADYDLKIAERERGAAIAQEVVPAA